METVRDIGMKREGQGMAVGGSGSHGLINGERFQIMGPRLGREIMV